MSKRWIVLFSAGSTAVAALLGLAVWLIAGSVDGPGLVGGGGDPPLGVNALAAMAIGLILTTALGIGLMALVFYSARSGADDGKPIDARAPGAPPQR